MIYLVGNDKSMQHCCNLFIFLFKLCYCCNEL